MATLDNIKQLVKYLPKKDIPIAEKLINKRDFEELNLLVSSAITKVKKDRKKTKQKEEYISIDIDMLEELSIEVITQLSYYDIELENEEKGVESNVMEDDDYALEEEW